MQIKTILWREWRFFLHRFWKITTSQLVTPILYIITFGIGLGDKLEVGGQPYLFFLMPGILSMVTMRNSYYAVSMRIMLGRLNDKSFETYIYAPMKMSSLTFGYLLAGTLRGLYAGAFIFIISFFTKRAIDITFTLVFMLVLNSLLFSAIGFIASMVVDTHYDLSRFTNMVITPMSFLCGTFYQVSGLPKIFKWIIELLPLTHTTRLIRGVSFGYGVDYFSLLIVLIYIFFLTVIAIRICYREITY